MLAVDRQQLYAMGSHGIRDQLAARDKAFFVGQRQIVPAFNGGQACAKARNAHHRVEHHIGALHGGQLAQALCPAQHTRCAGLPGQRCGQPVGCGFVGHANIFGVKLSDLLQNHIHLRVGGKAKHLVSLHAHHIQALGSDGAGGAQQRNFLAHFSHSPFGGLPIRPQNKRRSAPSCTQTAKRTARCRNDPECRRGRGRWCRSL